MPSALANELVQKKQLALGFPSFPSRKPRLVALRLGLGFRAQIIGTPEMGVIEAAHKDGVITCPPKLSNTDRVLMEVVVLSNSKHYPYSVRG